MLFDPFLILKGFTHSHWLRLGSMSEVDVTSTALSLISAFLRTLTLDTSATTSEVCHFLITIRDQLLNFLLVALDQ